MKVAFISFDFGEYSIRHANALAAAGADVLLVLARSAADTSIAELSPKVRTLFFDRPRFRQPLRCRRVNRLIVDTVFRFQPDVVHFQGGHLWFNFALPKLRRFPIVITAHNPRHHAGDQSSRRTPQWVMDYGYRQANRIIVHGDNLRQQVCDELGIHYESIDVVPHIVMGDATASAAGTEDPKTVLFFGRIWEYKGLEYLIRAEPLVSQAIPDVRIVIAGRGENFDRYRRMMVHPERFQIDNAFVPDEQREAYFRRAAVVVLPYTGATQSGVVPIAYNHAKPVIATRVGSLQEFVDHEETGLLVPPRDEEALAGAIIRLLNDDTLRRRLGKQGKRKIDAENSPASVADHHFRVYRAAMGFRGPAAIEKSGRECLAGVS